MRLTTVLTSWVLFGLLALSIVAWAQENPPRDVAGWQDTRGGMSALELKKLYGNKLKIKRQDGQDRRFQPIMYTRDGEMLTIDEYDLFGINFEVWFSWKDGSRLSKVIIFKEVSQADLSHVAAKLLSSLKFKYGDGNIIEKKYSDSTSAVFGNTITYMPGLDNLKVRWVFPKTVITYSQIIIKNSDPRNSIDMSSIHVFYEPNEANKL